MLVQFRSSQNDNLMNIVSSLIVLKALAKHETLTFPDLLQTKNLGIALPANEVKTALHKLKDQKLVTILDGSEPATYTITDKGIQEDKKLNI